MLDLRIQLSDDSPADLSHRLSGGIPTVNDRKMLRMCLRIHPTEAAVQGITSVAECTIGNPNARIK